MKFRAGQISVVLTLTSVAFATLSLAVACGSSAETASAASPDSGAPDATGPVAAADAEVDAAITVPTHAAASIAFDDHDPDQGAVDGTVLIGKSSDESDVSTYDIYWARSTGTIVSPIATIAKTGKDLSYALSGAVPAGAQVLEVFTANGSGEMVTGVQTTSYDHFAQNVDISAGQGTGSGNTPSCAIDALNHKLLVASYDDANMQKPALFRCNLDGTACAYVDISAGQLSASGVDPSIVVDAVNQKLLVVTQNEETMDRPGLFRCNLDGTSCTFTDISAGQAAHAGGNTSGLVGDGPSVAIDAVNNKLLVVADDGANNNKPGLFRCNLEGTSCAFTDLSAGQGTDSGDYPTVLVDTLNNKLLVVTENRTNSDRVGLFRCNLDGSSCAYIDISAGASSSSGSDPCAGIDSANHKLLVAAVNGANGDRLALFRCNLDGTGCTASDISAGQGANTALQPTLAVDSVNQKILVVTTAGLFRCNLDGTSCAYTNIEAGRSVGRGQFPHAVIDATNQTLLVVSDDSANSDKPSLMLLGL